MILSSFDLRKTASALVFALVIGLFTQVSFASTISGFVYGAQRQPLYDIDIELLNENYQLRDRTKTDGSGRYEFSNLADGRYTVRALPFRYDYQDQEHTINIYTINATQGSGTGNTFITQDFYLKPKQGGISELELGVIFAQDIPKEAERAYKNADKAFADKRNQEGVDELFRALKIFPDYYNALYRMGKQLYILKKYDDAWKFLLKATEVNPKSGVAYYYMGESFHKLGEKYNKAAITSLKQSTLLNPQFAPGFYTLGKVQRSAGKFSDAEKSLLKAKKLAKRPVAEIQKELVELYGNDLKKYKEAADELELYLKASKKNMSKEEQAKTKETITYFRNKAAGKTT